ncbi:MAG: bifunctional diaminohydroxyphosphoribosylaminopyrimidine deaminase/5-amino-6-(5-phosphoribosylamino)uracil reductase RibD [Deltaproteobacteria bacterium]|nr:bifunctional diaminohydroxyphosphoribosylaminopyrimidine deaminase/5-amino-6-(5-phosphoribosylamino)uracil reductase RibD [Deltaproteobacteria bacterium]
MTNQGIKSTEDLDQKWMRLAISQAKKAYNWTSPNPRVGAVIVFEQKLIAKAFHQRAGQDHAELAALKKSKSARGATLYVTLEPCCHTKKRTPPCVKSIIESKVKKVVVGCLDPNPQVAGKGVLALKKAGIEVVVGVLEEKCRALNPYYNYWIIHQLPWVILKVASSLDGRVALANGQSKWITSEESRDQVHQLRSQVDAILVGVGTLQADDPELTARLKLPVRQPQRVILDPQFKSSPQARVFHPNDRPTLLFSSLQKLGSDQYTKWESHTVEFLSLPHLKNGQLNLKSLLKKLGEKGVTSLIVEGGSKVWTQFVLQEVFNEVWYFVAPKILGSDALPAFSALGQKSLKNNLNLQTIQQVGSDVLLKYFKK